MTDPLPTAGPQLMKVGSGLDAYPSHFVKPFHIIEKNELKLHGTVLLFDTLGPCKGLVQLSFGQICLCDFTQRPGRESCNIFQWPLW